MLELYQNSFFRKMTKRKTKKIDLDKVLYIPVNEKDVLTPENLFEEETPAMDTVDENFPFTTDKKKFEADKYVQVRLISNKDWGGVNWKTGELIGSEAQHVSCVVIHIHGGSYVFGSAEESLPILGKYAKSTGFPIFSVDYRLAPNDPYPNGLSDCFQVYLWIKHYSKKYLNLTFDKIIMTGDSAGANLSVSVTSLCITKGVSPPDGIHI